MKFANKIVLVTGGTSGIGLESARLFQQEGARIIITGTRKEHFAEAEKILGKEVMALAVDLRDVKAIEAAFAEIRKAYGRLDVVFANAGAGTASPMDAVTEEQFDEQANLNFRGAFFTVQKSLPLLGKGSSIVMTTSFLNAVGTPGLSVLSATKAAVRSLVRTFAAELAPRGIRVNAVSPGPVSTPFHSKLGLTDAQLRDTAEAIEGQVPLRRFGEAGDIAAAALYLASDDASFATGTELVVDGGLTQI